MYCSENFSTLTKEFRFQVFQKKIAQKELIPRVKNRNTSVNQGTMEIIRNAESNKDHLFDIMQQTSVIRILFTWDFGTAGV